MWGIKHLTSNSKYGAEKVEGSVLKLVKIIGLDV